MNASALSKCIAKLNSDLGNDYRAKVYGDPSTEQEYLTQVEYMLDTGPGNDTLMLPNQPYTWAQIVSKQAESELEYQLDIIRNLRAPLLNESDWSVLSDNQLTDAKKAEWLTYRQALRDITNGITTAEQAINVAWPTKPAK